MKETLLAIAFIIASAYCFSQPKIPAGKQNIDTSGIWRPTDQTTEFICLGDINAYLDELEAKTVLTPREFLKLQAVLQDMVSRAIDRKRKQKQK